MRRRPKKRDLTDALLLIGGFGCTNFTHGHCARAGRLRDADFTADAWCDACIANEALRRPRGRESYIAVRHVVPVAASPTEPPTPEAKD